MNLYSFSRVILSFKVCVLWTTQYSKIYNILHKYRTFSEAAILVYSWRIQRYTYTGLVKKFPTWLALDCIARWSFPPSNSNNSYFGLFMKKWVAPFSTFSKFLSISPGRGKGVQWSPGPSITQDQTQLAISFSFYEFLFLDSEPLPDSNRAFVLCARESAVMNDDVEVWGIMGMYVCSS